MQPLLCNRHLLLYFCRYWHFFLFWHYWPSHLVVYYEKNEKHVLNTTVTQVPNNTKNTVSKTQDTAKISKVPNYNYSSKYQNQTPPSYESPPFESLEGKRGMNREPVVAENDDEEERKTLTERFLSVCPIFYVCFLSVCSRSGKKH